MSMNVIRLQGLPEAAEPSLLAGGCGCVFTCIHGSQATSCVTD